MIQAVQRARRRQLWVRGALYGAVAALACAAAAGFVARASSGLGRAALILSPMAFALTAGYFGVFRALRTVGDDARTARWIGDRVPALARDILAAVELRRALAREPNFSPQLAEAFLRDLSARAARVAPRAALDSRGQRRVMATAGLLTLVLLASILSYRTLWVAGVRSLVTPRGEAPRAQYEPITGDVELVYRYPAHTGLGSRTVKGTNGEISGPKGTEVQLKTRADREVQRASWIIDGRPTALHISEGRTLSGTLILEDSGTYHFAFLNGSGRELARGPDVAIRVEADAPPKAALLSPAEEVEVEDAQRVTLKYEASDDYGVSGLELVYRHSRDAEEKRVALKHDEGRRTQGQHTWDLAPLKLAPGDRISYYVQAKDNDGVAGAKTGASRTQVLKTYSAAEHRQEAVAKAEALWERLVTHLGDRLEAPDRARERTLAQVTGQQAVDQGGLDLVRNMSETARELSQQRDAPEALWSGLANISQKLGHRVRTTAEFRRLFARYVRLNGNDSGTGARLTRVLEEEIGEGERSVLYLESLLDRQKLEALKEAARDLTRERRELASLLEQFRKAPDAKLQEEILRQVSQLKERVDGLMKRMSELMRGIRDEHLNAEALKEMMEEQDFSSALDEIEKQVREGKPDEALSKLQQLAMQMDEMLKNLDDAADSAGGEQYSELSEKFQEFMKDLQETSQRQEATAKQTQDIRNRYKGQMKQRLAERGKALKESLQREVEEIQRDYRQIGPEPLSSRADAPM
ncbi:MAG TPA: DUF4175 family protein, partial [Myxococcaceae bacterium]|nr:DUF4175 family protein [Myxococcaceae bacterium]